MTNHKIYNSVAGAAKFVLAFALMLSAVHAQSLQPPSLVQQPTQVSAATQPPARLNVNQALNAPLLNPPQVPVAQPGAQWVLVPNSQIIGNGTNQAFVRPGNGQQYILPSSNVAIQRPVQFPSQRPTAQPIFPNQLQSVPLRMAGAPAELPFSFPKPNVVRGVPTAAGQQQVAPAKPKTTTWGTSSGLAPVTQSGNGFSGSSPGIMYEGNTGAQGSASNGATTHGCAAGDADSSDLLEPIAAGDKTDEDSGGAGVAANQNGVVGTTVVEVFEPNLSPPWSQRLFPNWEPAWTNTRMWQRFDTRRQKMSAGVHNLVAQRRAKKVCSEGCQCDYCRRERRRAKRDFGGWLSWGTTVNSHGNKTSTGNDPLGFNNFGDGFLLNQAWLHAARNANPTNGGFDWGYRADFLFGADAPDTAAFGDQSWDFSWATGGEYGFALPQAYVTLGYSDLLVNFGRFYTIIGYETVQAPNNFFYSRSLTFNYNEPFTHTGMLAQYEATNNLTLFGGYTLGWDSGYRNQNEGGTFLGGARYDLSDRLNVFYALSAGDPGDSSLGESDVYMHSLVANAILTENTNYVFQWDYQDRTTFGFPRTESHAINQHLLTKINDKLSVGTRFEWFHDADGARIGNGPGDYFDLTFGLNYRTDRNFVLRPEVRYDWFDGAGLPYDDNTEHDQFTFGLGGYWRF